MNNMNKKKQNIWIS